MQKLPKCMINSSAAAGLIYIKQFSNVSYLSKRRPKIILGRSNADGVLSNLMKGDILDTPYCSLCSDLSIESLANPVAIKVSEKVPVTPFISQSIITSIVKLLKSSEKASQALYKRCYFLIENVLGLLKDDMYYTHINAFVEEILLFPPKKRSSNVRL